MKDGFTKEYPFSVKPDKKLGVRDVMALHRDHFEGTPFDMTKGLAAGPFGSPYRYIGKYDGAQNNVGKNTDQIKGSWERPLSVFYCGYIYVNQARSWLPDEIGGITWFGPDKPYLTCFVPFYAGMTDLAKPYQTGTTRKFDRNKAWWAFNFVSNIAGLKFSHMKIDILQKQKELEEKTLKDTKLIETIASELYKKDPSLAKKYLTEYATNHSKEVLDKWWELGYYLIAKYNDGYINFPKMGAEVGYPKEWLKKVGYDKGPISYRIKSQNK